MVGKMWIRPSKHIYILIIAVMVALGAAAPTESYHYSSRIDGIEIYYMPINATAALNRVVELINDAHQYVYVASFILTQQKIINALINASHRGLDVRVVSDEDTMIDNQQVISQLKDAGIRVVLDRRRGDYMHNKFIVIDDQIVVTGSTNLMDRSFYRNTNDLLIIHNSEVAADYKEEFLELFGGVFGGGKPTSHPYIGGEIPVEVYFSPDDHVASKIKHYISIANKTIYVAAFVFTNQELAKALANASRRGVSVLVVFESYTLSHYSTMKLIEKTIESSGGHVYGDVNPYTMHCKFFIIDDKIVITGSYNPSYHAEYRNDENIVIIHSPQVAETYTWFFMNYVMPNGTRIILHIRDEFGQPLSGATVYAEDLNRHATVKVITGENGEAVIHMDGMEPGDKISLTIKYDDFFGSTNRIAVTLNLGPNYVDFSMEKYNYRLIVFFAGIIVLLIGGYVYHRLVASKKYRPGERGVITIPPDYR